MTDKKKCPYCAEEIAFESIKCRFCGEFLDKNPHAEEGNTTPMKIIESSEINETPTTEYLKSQMTEAAKEEYDRIKLYRDKELKKIISNQSNYRSEIVEAAKLLLLEKEKRKTETLAAKEKIESSNKKCPFCNEEISSGANKCKHCGEWIDSTMGGLYDEKKNLTVGLIFAAIFEFLDSLFWFVIAYFQAELYFKYHNETIGITSLWNFFMAFAIIAIGIGILKKTKWGYDWGVGSAVLNIGVQGYLAYNAYNTWNKDGLFPLVLLVTTQAVILVLLIVNKNEFPSSKIRRR